MYSDDYLYTKEHEWVRVENGEATLGITHHAQEELGEIVFVELPEVGKVLAAGDTLGSVESVKAVSDVYAPVSGEVIAANDLLADKPELVNQEPHGGGWIARIRLSDKSELDSLMSADDYEAYLGEEKKH
ncbi:MAG TPA: glycine cleavage system protein GcvH [Acidobacteriota bacterium]|nr:glycine cleavage system protein GcvH [Acidobacteriota bacterium]HOT00219.1 glycine cleavage system protein GcvH [Acidobacteriota bacterium]HQF88624.1 glycine cleavage system protein GcvH [Acidobacteriota bacterium]HQG91522.1 glycine cleavage system protein GcvH [Acidobacteriota bacterium]HQK86494.1 glycine cleavage system protein GcvH [Acidobacteriota bacterium]